MSGLEEYFRRNTIITEEQAALIRYRALREQLGISMIDPVLDMTWGRSAQDLVRPSSYFDYFFAGQDMKIRVAEVPETDPKFGILPIVNFAYSVEQEKRPIYGAFSYTYDGDMRGVRLVSGAFTLVTKYPDYMKECLQVAARNRANRANIDQYSYRPLTEDDENIERYWNKNVDVGVSAGGTNLFSAHPPFSFVLTYGLEPISVDAVTSDCDWFVDQYDDWTTNTMMQDDNHRLVESDPSYGNRIIIDDVELKSMQRSYDSDQVCVEVYTFFAREALSPITRSTSNVQDTMQRIGPS